MPESSAPLELHSPAEVEAVAESILPGMPLRLTGVSHVVAGVSRDGDLCPFRVQHPAAPRSRWDRLLLDLSRLRAEAIVITGAILRDEPSLVYACDPGWAEAFAETRRALGLRARPLLMILTRVGVPSDHPALEGAVEPHILEVGTLAEAISAARARGASSVSIEAGPRTATELYRERGRVDELLFHRFPGPLPDNSIAGYFARERDVTARLGEARSRVHVQDGPVRSVIERYAR